MRYIKTFEKFEINENWFNQALSWIKDKFNNWMSKLSGDIKAGAEWAKDYLEKNRDVLNDILLGLKQQAKSEVDKLYTWCEYFVGKPDQLQPIVTESHSDEEEEVNSIFSRIARISGVSLRLFLVFAPAVAAFTGLLISSGPLFVVGAIVSVILYSLLMQREENENEEEDDTQTGW